MRCLHSFDTQRSTREYMRRCEWQWMAKCGRGQQIKQININFCVRLRFWANRPCACVCGIFHSLNWTECPVWCVPGLGVFACVWARLEFAWTLMQFHLSLHCANSGCDHPIGVAVMMKKIKCEKNAMRKQLLFVHAWSDQAGSFVQQNNTQWWKHLDF